MPLIEVTLLEGRLREGVAAELIRELTDSFVGVVGEAARDQTWVIVNGVESERFGVAGRPLPPVSDAHSPAADRP
jgi:4-oxalocrotonate tautomerase